MKIVSTKKGLKIRSGILREQYIWSKDPVVRKREENQFPMPVSHSEHQSIFSYNLNLSPDTSITGRSAFMIDEDPYEVNRPFVGKKIPTPFRSLSKDIDIKGNLMHPDNEIIPIKARAEDIAISCMPCKSSKELQLIRLHNKRKLEQENIHKKLREKVNQEIPTKKFLEDVTTLLEKCRSENTIFEVVGNDDRLKNIAKWHLKEYKKGWDMKKTFLSRNGHSIIQN
ncbi:unnamed protein product [Blepharisma stoltei]|uniref:Uncharacterized protein n=1 Tax=Blepharisma stoltei TaxID=1481888 RepID=A0AAU9K853_9CILI|nr:unnamed protein product [Blepharisma stoltei]